MPLSTPRLLCLVLLPAALWVAPGRAHASGFEWLRSENGNVREGNEKLAAGDAKGALSAYDRAARELPAEGGVHLNRGIALLRDGQLGPARDALRLANQGSTPAAVRADASYDLGIAFYRDADALAGENKHEEAQKSFREAADAFKHALRTRPGDRNAGFNYELAKRRIQEQEQKQKQKQKQEQEQKQQDEQQKKSEDENSEQKPDQPQDPSEGDKKPEDQASKDQPKPEDDGKPKSDPGKPGDQPKSPEQAGKEQPKPEQPKGADKPQPSDEERAQPEPQPSADQGLKPEVARALDALEDGEQNLERVRALNRAARERRKPEKDW